MGDSSKPKNPQACSLSCSTGSSNVASPANRYFAPQPDLDAQIAASPSLVSSAKDSWAWLEKKGWLLNSEDVNARKLADILFSAALSFKLPPAANVAIRSVAHILRELSDDVISSLITDKLSDCLSSRIGEHIDTLKAAIMSAKNFLEATTQQQAEDLIGIQETLKKQEGLVKALTDVVDKLPPTSNPQGLIDSSWPPLLQSGVRPGNVPSSSTPHLVPQTSNKLIQRTSLASKQLLIDYGPEALDDPSRDKTIEAQRGHRGMFNDWIDISLPPTEEGTVPAPPSQAVRNISIFDSPLVLLEFDSAESKSKFEKICSNNPNLLAEFSPKARICPRTYAVILHFVPCSGLFDPSLEAHLREVEVENNLPPNSIVSATWCKRPEKRSPNQKMANLKVFCANPEAANMFITGRIHVDDHLVNAHKDIKLPIRCVKCQEYSHTRDSCIGVEKCANCASTSHPTSSCTNEMTPLCVSCSSDSRHASSSPKCLVFAKKCAALDERSPKNAMPYFPTNKAWTWSMAPNNPPCPASPLSNPLPMRTSSRL